MANQMMLVYLLGGVVFAVFVISWALSTKQFRDQDRARFLPLRDLSAAQLETPARHRMTASVGLVFVVFLLSGWIFGLLIVALVA
jgi:nitrogen fixation-related uncharacterized protein